MNGFTHICKVRGIAYKDIASHFGVGVSTVIESWTTRNVPKKKFGEVASFLRCYTIDEGFVLRKNIVSHYDALIILKYDFFREDVVDDNLHDNKSTGLKYLLQKSGIGQTNLANKLGVTRQLVEYWCNGKQAIPIKRIEKISEIMWIPKQLEHLLAKTQLTKQDKLAIIKTQINRLSYLRGTEECCNDSCF